MKKGKIKSFLLYTIGEVFLVVIGILIALQIDNWNRERIENKELQEYLTKVSENVAEDISLATINLERRKKIASKSKEIIIKLMNEEVMKLDDIYQNIDVFVDFHFVSKKSGMESLTNAGFINELEKSKLDSLLFDYYLIVEDLQREEQSFNGFIESMESAAYSQERFLSLFGQYLGIDLDSNDVQLGVNNYFQNVPIQGAFLRSSGQNAILRRYEKLINTGEMLQSEIKNMVENQ